MEVACLCRRVLRGASEENDSVIKEYVGSKGSTGRQAIVRASQGDAVNLTENP